MRWRQGEIRAPWRWWPECGSRGLQPRGGEMGSMMKRLRRSMEQNGHLETREKVAMRMRVRRKRDREAERLAAEHRAWTRVDDREGRSKGFLGSLSRFLKGRGAR